MKQTPFLRGMRDGLPVAAGYFAVSFALGITARACGLNWVQATLSSLLTNASAGQYEGFELIRAAAPWLEVVVMITIINARYFLMSCSLSQKLDPDTPLLHRLLLGQCVTDEIFALSAAVPGRLDVRYSWGAFAVASPAWALGTCLGVVLGDVLPGSVVSALGVGLYGMFVAIVMPQARQNRVIGVLVLLCAALGGLVSVLPFANLLSQGTWLIVLTVLIAGGAAALFPVRDEEEEAQA